MKSKKAFISIMMIMVLIATMLTGCGGAQETATQEAGTQVADTSEEVRITYWTQSSPPYPAVAERLIAEFEATYPNIKVQLESFPEYRTKVNTAFSTNNAPDVLEVYGSAINFARGGRLLPVPDSLMTKDQIEASFQVQALKNKYYDGKYYGLPNEINMESPGLVVNTALVEKAGLQIPDSWIENNGPATWEELMDFARKLTIIENNVMQQAGLGVIRGQEESMFLSLIWQLGGDYRDPDNMKVNFNIPEAKKAIEFMLDLVDGPNRVHDRGFIGRLDGLTGNTIAMSIGAPWYAAVLDNDVADMEYQYFNLPPFITGANPYYMAEGGWGYLVSSGTKNPEAAWTFVNFLLEKENQEYWTETVGAFPSRVDAELPAYDPSKGSAQKALSISADIAEYGMDPGSYTMDTGQLVWTIVRQNLRAMLQEEVTIEEGLKNLDQEANEMIQRAQSQ